MSRTIVERPGSHPNINYNADLLFNYTVHENSYLTTSLFGVYSNTIQFEKIKNTIITNLNNTQINIDNTYFSNETWNNTIKSFKKALEYVKNNGTINLNDINIMQNTAETMTLDKNITLIGKNATFALQKNTKLFETTADTIITFINLTFTGNNQYIITNKGKLQLINCTFKENNNGLIDNNGYLEIKDCMFLEIDPLYLDRPTIDINGLIRNNATLKITNTLFYNEQLVPYNYPTESERITSLIYNTGTLTINNTDIININDKIIYNTGQSALNNVAMKNIIFTSSSAIYKTSKLQQLTDQYTYNIYNAGQRSKSGNVIYNTGMINLNNTQINKSGGRGIYNTGVLNLNNTIISECSGIGAAIYNINIMNIENSKITKSYASTSYDWREEEQSNGMIFSYITAVYSGVIYTGENAKANITKSIISENNIYRGTNNNWAMYYGTVKNDGAMNISGCIFDNNIPKDWESFWGGQGSINIYNTGKLTVMYSYLLNTKQYIRDPDSIHAYSPHSFLFNAGGTSTLNYNFYCLEPSKIISNAKTNYYFIPAFEDDYYPIKLGQNTNITLTLKLTNGTDTIEFNDWDKLLTPGLNTTITTIDENGEYINITTLLKDKITFNFNYTGIKAEYPIYANILNYKNEALVDVGKEFANMTVDYHNITYDEEDMTFHIKITGNLTLPTGNITFTLNKQKYTVNLTDGECNFTVPTDLKPGNYTIKIEYNGDSEYFKILKHNYLFTIFKIPTQVNITSPGVNYGQTGIVTVTLAPDAARLYANIYIDGKILKKNIAVMGTQTFTLNRGVGTYNLTIVIDEDEYYTGCVASTIFTVSKWKTNMTVEAQDIKVGENATINITINPGDVRGNAILSVNGENRSIFINDTMTPITLTGLDEGTYNITVYYPGDKKYAPSNATTTFIVGRMSSKLNVTITQNANLTGTIKIVADPLNCTSEVIIYVNNEKTTLNLTNGKTTAQIKLKRGSNYIYIYYTGDGNYTPCDWNTTFSIEGIPVLTLETQDLASDKTGYVRVNLTDTNNIPYEYTNITIEFQNTNTTLTTDENGTVYFPVNTKAGIYEITAYYENATITKNITVKTLTLLTVSIQSINEADDLMVYATLTDSNNNKRTADVILEINGNYYKIVITNGAGSRNLGEFKHGTYTYTAIYQGDTLIYPSNTTGSFQVKTNSYKITGNKNIVQYYGATKTYKIRLLNNNQPVKGEIITVKIGKNTVKVKTDNQGYATLKLNLKAGKYTITSTYKNVKVSNKITVKPTLITKNKKIKKGKTLTYTAKLLNKNGKALKNKKIAFKIKGKKYKAKTNKKGVAKIKVKNLKKGKYKIITTYGKQKNTNTLTVK